MKYLRVIRDGPLPGAANMARDSELLAAHRADSDPWLRLYRWSPPAVSLGYHQDPLAFDISALAARGYDLVQRPTGGRAILHAEELTYAVVGTSPSSLFGSTLHDTYRAINAALLAFLAVLGLQGEVSRGESRSARRGLVCFHSAGQHEIKVGGRKLIGSAQRRIGRVFLQHGSILTGPAHAELVDFQRAAAAHHSSRQQLLAATTDLGSLLKLEPDEPTYEGLGRQLVDAFAKTFGLPAEERPPP